MDIRGKVRALLERSATGRAVLDARRRSRLPDWWERSQQDERAIKLVIALTLTPDSNAIDVGASVGRNLRRLVERAPAGCHLAFEPLPHRADALRRDFPNVDVREVALSDAEGDAEFLVVGDDDGWSSLAGESRAAEQRVTQRLTVRTQRLDDALPDGYAPALIKIDVEGAEVRVITGAERTLREHRPVLVIEHGGGGVGRTSPDDLFPLLTGLGYDVFDIDGRGPYSLTAMNDVFASGELYNWIALPTPSS